MRPNVNQQTLQYLDHTKSRKRGGAAWEGDPCQTSEEKRSREDAVTVKMETNEPTFLMFIDTIALRNIMQSSFCIFGKQNSLVCVLSNMTVFAALLHIPTI